MTQVVSDLTVSVEKTYDVDGETLFRAMLDPAVAGAAERVSADDDSSRRPSGPPPGLQAGETYVADVDAPLGSIASSFETYVTVEASEYPRVVLAGGGDGESGSFDARIVVAIADVPEGAMVRFDVKMDVAGEVAALGAETVRAAATRTVERYFSTVERELPRAS
jgi:carbon monoxide dehydrogenase subunit G